METENKKNDLGWPVLIILLVIGGFIWWSVASDQEKKATENAQAERLVAESNRQLNIDACIASAQREYFSDWNAECSRLFRPTGCALSAWSVNRFDEVLKANKELCLKRY